MVEENITKKQLQITKSILVNGPKQAMRQFSVTQDQVFTALIKTKTQDLQLIKILKDLILTSICKKGTKAVSQQWGLNQHFLQLFHQKASQTMLNLSLAQQKEIQTEFRHLKQYKDQINQTQEKFFTEEDFILEPKKKNVFEEKKQMAYSNAQKIEAVRRFVKYPNQNQAAKQMKIPLMTLLRWSETIQNELFQKRHVSLCYKDNRKGQKRQFFAEVDGAIYLWAKEHLKTFESVDLALKEKAQEIARLSEEDPIVIDEWVEKFRAYYNI